MRPTPAVLAALVLACAAPKPAGPPLPEDARNWKAFRSVGVRVTATAPKAEIERNWLERMLLLELKRANLFAAVEPVRPEALRAGTDLLIVAEITRVQRGGSLKLNALVRYVHDPSGAELGREALNIRTTISARELRTQHKAAGQAGLRVAERVIDYLRKRRN